MIISVIIPVYNTADKLDNCLNSVLSQTFDDWECLLIDDGSTDESGAICDRYAERDGRFKVFHTANSGVSSARNLGIEHAQGRYMAFIDSDDSVDEEYLAALYGAMNERVELAVCGLRLIRPSSIENLCAKGGELEINTENADWFAEVIRLLSGPCVKLYRMAIIKDENIRFPLGIHYGEDLIFNFQYLDNVRRISVVGEAYYNYFLSPQGTLSTAAHSQDLDLRYHQWTIVRNFIKQRGIESQSAKEYLSNSIWVAVYDKLFLQKLSMKEIKELLNDQVCDVLMNYNANITAISQKNVRRIAEKRYMSIWIKQRKNYYRNI